MQLNSSGFSWMTRCKNESKLVLIKNCSGDSPDQNNLLVKNDFFMRSWLFDDKSTFPGSSGASSTLELKMGSDCISRVIERSTRPIGDPFSPGQRRKSHISHCLHPKKYNRVRDGTVSYRIETSKRPEAGLKIKFYWSWKKPIFEKKWQYQKEKHQKVKKEVERLKI